MQLLHTTTQKRDDMYTITCLFWEIKNKKGRLLFMNELKIFNNPDFGDIRTMLIDGEPWFVGKDVATALGYSNPQKAVRDHVSEEDRGVNEMDTPSGKQNLVLINESGLYALIFGSKLESAQRFKRWVTSEVLPAIRKTGGYNAPVPMTVPEQIQLLAMGSVELTQRVDRLDQKLDRLEADLPILGVEIEKITNAVNKMAVACLGGKNSNAYQDRSLRGKVYSDVYSELKRQFGVSTYKAIKRNQCDDAIGVIGQYKLPYILAEQVQSENAQMNLWGGAER